MTTTGAMLIKYDAVTFENFLRFIIPVGVIAWMLHLDGKLFYKKGDEEIKYSKIWGIRFYHPFSQKRASFLSGNDIFRPILYKNLGEQNPANIFSKVNYELEMKKIIANSSNCLDKKYPKHLQLSVFVRTIKREFGFAVLVFCFLQFNTRLSCAR